MGSKVEVKGRVNQGVQRVSGKMKGRKGSEMCARNGSEGKGVVNGL